MSRRVVITGIGLVSALGIGTRETWAGLLAGQSGVGRVTRFDVSAYAAQIAAEVKGFDPLTWIEKKDIKKMDLFIQYAIAAAQFAMDDSKLTITPEYGPDVGAFIGSGIGGFITIEREHEALLKGGPRKVSPFFIPSAIINLASGQVSIRFGAKGPNSATCTACSASAHAIGDAYEIIRRGDADVMLAGGSEAPVVLISMAAFGNMHALSTRNDDPRHASRPFDAKRDGFVLSEGAATLVLEAEEFALARKAPILAEVAGYAATDDAHHVTDPAPNGEGGARAMRIALAKAGLRPEDVQYINAHGTSTFAGDRAEIAAIKSVFGDYAYQVPISSTKGATGNMLGAGGAVEAAFCIQAMRDGIIPPTLNYEFPDPECDLDVVPNQARKVGPLDVTMSNAFGFGGHNVTLVLRSYRPDR